MSSLSSPPRRIAVVGAGIGGLRCAALLQDHGHHVTVFEKARGPGGRMSSRRAPEPFGFDHGAQYFTVRDRRFAEEVESWQRHGLVARWNGSVIELDAGRRTPRTDGNERFVGTPRMSAIGRHLARGLDLHTEVRIDRLERVGASWILHALDGPTHGPFDVVATNAPPAQAEALIRPVHGALADRITAAQMAPCMAVLVGWRAPLSLPFDGAFVRSGPLSWVARNSSKPGRDGGECWVLHGSPEWSREHFDADRTAIAEQLVDAFAEACGQPVPAPEHVDTHRWAYAQVERSIDAPCLFDAGTGLGACGDWCGDGRVEGAFSSGQALADAILASR